MSLPPISAEALAPLATILRGEPGRLVEIPEVTAHDATPGRHALAILSPQPVAGNTASIASLERHPHTTQTFVPMRVSRWLVLVVPSLADGSPDAAAAKAFVAGPGDAICIGRNVWHAGLTVFDAPAEFAMIMWKAEAGDDGELFALAAPITVSLD
jgi:ureidoglycolate lyase